jgi:phage I-like protein
MNNAASSTAIEIARPVEGRAPDWVQLFPIGPDIFGVDGRVWRIEDPQRLVEAFDAGGRPLPIDWEHSSFVRGEKGEYAPAAGWIAELQVRDGVLWGRAEWTERGLSSVASREYRYLSPVFYCTAKDGLIRAMRGAGLTNLPNLHMTALNRAAPEQEPDMSLALIALALGQPEAAKAEDLVTACNRLTAQVGAPDPARFAPREELTTALNRAQGAEAELTQLKTAAAEAAVTEAVDRHVVAGRIAPASKDFYTAACRAQGVAAFDAFAETLPVIGGEQKPKTDPATDKPAAGALSVDELAMCRATGRAPADFATFKAADAAS